MVAAPDVPPNEVRAKPLPFRIVAPHGRGAEGAFFAARGGEIVTAFERYTGRAFPYAKLDFVAAPDRQGAEEHAGAITFEESEILFDPRTASKSQLENNGSIVAHETAHQWFGDLVTGAWWDDIWLNEAFASWIGNKIADGFRADPNPGLRLASNVHGALEADSLTSARQIRQPITSVGEIGAVFDAITYGKGSGVLAMFEAWLGPDVFRDGVRRYLDAHADGSATEEDFLSALSSAAGKDVRAAFHSFLDQPGAPFLETRVACEGEHARLLVKQSRYLPLGTAADASETWQLPVCARYEVAGKLRESWALVTERDGQVPLDACPAWVLPNAGALGYYRFALAPADLQKLIAKGLNRLTPAEKLAYADSLEAAFARGTAPMSALLAAAAPLVDAGEENLVDVALDLPSLARDWLADDPLRARVEAYGRRLVAKSARRLGWDPKPGESAEEKKLRHTILVFLAETGNDPATRAEAKRRARAFLGDEATLHPDALDPELLSLALAVEGEDADRTTFERLKALYARMADPVLRRRLLVALGRARDPDLADRALEMSVNGSVDRAQALLALYVALYPPDTRAHAWLWAKRHFPALVEVAKGSIYGGALLANTFERLCTDADAKELEALVAPYADSRDGGKRAAASTVEKIRVCAAEREAQIGSARAFFGGGNEGKRRR